jgi:hypothetical protein
MRTPRDRIPILWSLHRTPCRRLVFTLSLSGTAESESVSARSAVRRLPARVATSDKDDVDLGVEGLLLHPTGEG